MKNLLYRFLGIYTTILGGTILAQGNIDFIAATSIGFCGLVTLTQTFKKEKK